MDKPETLEAKLVKKVHEWLAQAALRVRDGADAAEITFRIAQPQGEEDNTLFLDCTVEEKVYEADMGGVVPGVKFDKEVGSAPHHMGV